MCVCVEVGVGLSVVGSGFKCTLGGQKYCNTSEANKWRMTPINFVVARLARVLSANGHTNKKTISMKPYLKYNFFDFRSSKLRN